MKKLISVLITAAMLLAALPFTGLSVSAAYENTHVNTSNQIEDLIAVAMTQLGYCEGNSSSQTGGTIAGSGNYTKYGSWYGINPGAWCAMFVSWCANQAGIPTSVIPKHASCDVGMNWFKSNGRWYYSKYFGGSYTPKRGDIIYFGNSPTNLNDSTHVGIVTGSDSSYVYTVEGNKGDKCKTYSYSLNDDYIFGYGIPNYSGSASTPLGTYIVTASTLNLRASPSSSATIVSTLSNGTAIIVTAVSGNWAYTTYGSVSGWCSMSYLLAQNDLKYAVSNDGIDLIKGLEGFSQYAYWDVSQWSIGYGTGCGENEYPSGITQSAAEALLRSALVKYELYVNSFISSNNITLNQNQYDALVSFTYNLGNIWGNTFTLKTYLINGVSNYTDAQIRSAFGEFVSAGGTVLAGLVARRATEANYFLSGGTETVSENYITTASWLNMREGPGTSYDIVTSLPNGSAVTVTQTSGYWGYTVYNGYSGWISLNYCEKVKSYTITFDPGSGTMSGDTVYGVNTGDYYNTIFDSLPVAVWSGHTLTGWYNAKYNYTLSLADSEYFAVSENITFVAQWTADINTYTVIYDANGGSGAPLSQIKTENITLTLSNDVPVRDGFDFLGWALSSSATAVAYPAGASFFGNGNVTLYAVWKQKVQTVKIYADGILTDIDSALDDFASDMVASLTLPSGTDISGYTISMPQNGKITVNTGAVYDITKITGAVGAIISDSNSGIVYGWKQSASSWITRNPSVSIASVGCQYGSSLSSINTATAIQGNAVGEMITEIGVIFIPKAALLVASGGLGDLNGDGDRTNADLTAYYLTSSYAACGSMSISIGGSGTSYYSATLLTQNADTTVICGWYVRYRVGDSESESIYFPSSSTASNVKPSDFS